jgi:hypothetical protein
MSLRLLTRIASLLLPLATMQLYAAATRVATTTAFVVSPNTAVMAGTVVTLAALVTNPGPVQRGTVKFCEASISNCDSGVGLYGSAQLTQAGTATLRMRFGVGTHIIRAVYAPTLTNAGSSSITTAFNILPNQVYASSTTLDASGGKGDYDLTGTVTAFGSQSMTGTVQFLDTTNNNVLVGTTVLKSATMSFAGINSNPTGSSPISVAAADFNGDGITDLVVANSGINTVSVFLGNENGSFQPQIMYSLGLAPFSIVAVDLNNDGKIDIAVANDMSDTISVLLGNGDGTFQSQNRYSTGLAPFSVVAGDFNGDGIEDLACANNGGGTVSVLLGNGDGTFQSQISYAAGPTPFSIATGDFNGDGRADLVVTNISSRTVSVLLGNGDGTFQTQSSYATGSAPISIAVGDFNGDGKADLVTANNGSNTVSVILGNGDGTFQPQISYATDSAPRSVAIGDLNEDGRADLAIANVISNTVSILMGNGDGSFQPQVSYATGLNPFSLLLGDFNGDGIEDIATSDGGSSSMSVMLGEQVASYAADDVTILGIGAHNILASYSGDGSRVESQSSIVSLLAQQTSTAIVASSANPSVFGTSVTFNVTVAAGATGSVTFLDGATAFGRTAIGSGIGSISTSTLSAGEHSITAVYEGDSNFSQSTSRSLLQTVNKAAVGITLVSSMNPAVFGQTLTITAMVTPGATGSIAFTDGADTLGTVPLSGTGLAALTYSGLAAGAHSILATYSGDPNFF